MARKTGSAAAAQASAEVFVTAFRALPRRARIIVLTSLVEAEDLREDVEAALLWEQRKDEPRRPLREFLAEHPEI
jgi:hypothetical protein